MNRFTSAGLKPRCDPHESGKVAGAPKDAIILSAGISG
jgi:hypothetical protein